MIVVIVALSAVFFVADQGISVLLHASRSSNRGMFAANLLIWGTLLPLPAGLIAARIARRPSLALAGLALVPVAFVVSMLFGSTHGLHSYEAQYRESLLPGVIFAAALLVYAVLPPSAYPPERAEPPQELE